MNHVNSTTPHRCASFRLTERGQGNGFDRHLAEAANVQTGW